MNKRPNPLHHPNHLRVVSPSPLGPSDMAVRLEAAVERGKCEGSMYALPVGAMARMPIATMQSHLLPASKAVALCATIILCRNESVLFSDNTLLLPMALEFQRLSRPKDKGFPLSIDP